MFDGYYIWLKNLIDTDSHLAWKYKKLLKYLYEREYTWVIPNDSNRNLDGLELRTRYEREVGINPEEAFEHLDGSCSVLEMMVALACRMEVEIMHDDDFGDRSADWFWNMIGSLGLSEQIDDRFDMNFVEKSIDILVENRFQRDGRGSLFTLTTCRKDLRKVEVWYQMNYWLEENFPIIF